MFPRPRPVPPDGRADPPDHGVDALLARVARGDADAFAGLYDRCADQVYGIVRRVLRDPAQSEEVAQEVLVEVWRTAPRYDRAGGPGLGWILTIAHRRAVDRVRSEEASRRREDRAGQPREAGGHDEVAEAVELRLEHQQVRRAVGKLTDLQREAVELAYYGGHTYREVSTLLDIALPTVKTRMRDGLIRLRDCLSVEVIR
jgi:RNA polymerase sigma-70 factor, ECF subfamily